MFTFLDEVRAYLQANTTFEGAIKLSGTLDGSLKSTVSIRSTPGRMGARYLQGKDQGVSFQILAKDPSETVVAKLMDELANLCENLTKQDIPNLVKCEIYVTPNFVEKTATNETIYQAMFNAEITKE